MSTLSIIITCYNGWKYMNNCLCSLENQTVIPDEIIIVDDCSLDDSFEQLEKYIATSKLNIKLIKNEKNSGPGVSREIGLKNATKEYIAFCDCDDWYEEDFISDIKRRISQEPTDIYIFDNYTAYDDGRKSIAHSTKWLLSAGKNEIIGLYSMSLWRFAFRKAVLCGIEHSDLYYAEDAVVALQAISKAETITIIDKPYYNYLYREGSASDKPSPKVYKSFEKAFDIIYSKIGTQYPLENEFIGVKMICYGATLNAFKAHIAKCEIKRFIEDFEIKYPEWQKNNYISTLGKIKRVYLFFIKKKMLFLAKIMGLLHSKIIRLRRG